MYNLVNNDVWCLIFSPGRAGKTGCSITLIERRDRKQAQELIQILEEAGQDVPEELVEMAAKYQRWKEREAEARKSGGGGGGDAAYHF